MRPLGAPSQLLSFLLVPLGVGLATQGGPTQSPEARPFVAVSYAEEIAPIFEKRCVWCHGGMDKGKKRVELSLDMTTYEALMAGSEYGPVVEPGDADGSLLVDMIATGDMPDEGDPVLPEELKLIRQWILEGALNN